MSRTPQPNHPQVVFITGASSGIGFAAALAFARDGANVIVTARRVDRLAALETAVHQLPDPHGAIFSAAADVRHAEEVQSAVERGIERFGRIDVAVANAGIGQRGSLVDSTWENIETLLRTNIDGVLHTIRAVVPHMREQGGGHLIVVSSVVANMITPYTAAYSASKAFVSSIAHSLRFELADDHITVTDMRVGRTMTEFNEKRLGAAGYAQKAPRLPVMTPEQVGDAMVRAARRRSARAILRPLDHAIVLANILIPNVIGRRALKQYRT